MLPFFFSCENHCLSTVFQIVEAELFSNKTHHRITRVFFEFSKISKIFFENEVINALSTSRNRPIDPLPSQKNHSSYPVCRADLLKQRFLLLVVWEGFELVRIPF